MTSLQSLLTDTSLLATKAYINGEWLDGLNGRTFNVLNPANGEVIAKVSDIDVSQTRDAIAYASSAGKDWASRTAKERSHTLRKWHNLMLENQDDWQPY